jgi:hypothetical protein
MQTVNNNCGQELPLSFILYPLSLTPSSKQTFVSITVNDSSSFLQENNNVILGHVINQIHPSDIFYVVQYHVWMDTIVKLGRQI